jgi:hypothetical protein
VVREATLGPAHLLQRIELAVAGSTREGRGFVATAASPSAMFMMPLALATDRPIRSLSTSGVHGLLHAAGTFQSVTSTRANLTPPEAEGIITIGAAREGKGLAAKYVLSASLSATPQTGGALGSTFLKGPSRLCKETYTSTLTFETLSQALQATAQRPSRMDSTAR